MRLSFSKSKNSLSLYIIKDITVKGKRTTKVYEKLGTYDELKEKLNGGDPIQWAKQYVEELNKAEKEENKAVMVKYSPIKAIPKGKIHTFNGGYLFLQQIYYELGLNKICNTISEKYKFTYDFNSILSRLIYGRIIFPSSKRSTYELSKNFLEEPNFQLQHIYRALEVISKEIDFIQSSLYKNSLKVSKRNTGVLFYDCTNYFFEIDEAEGLKQYGFAKDHKPNPIVQMGLFMDGDGIPLAFSITKGNTNEQLTLKPLEKKILSDFNLSKFVVCTDAGLASNCNRKFNDIADRAFITTQSIKKLKNHLKKWALDKEDWYLFNDNNTLKTKRTYNISTLDEEKNKDTIFYKERWIKENGLEQKIIVTYSIKYRDYQRSVRNSQIDRAIKAISKNPSKLKKLNQNDYRRFVVKTYTASDGKEANKESYSINEELIEKEEAFDGFYAVCTNLDDNANNIVKINKRRWLIEECFKIMKSEFKARPVYLSRDDRIIAHFTTCFIALIIFRLLEKKLGNNYTYCDITQSLRDMNFYEVKGEGYLPSYTRTDFTDDLHDVFSFRTDYEIIKTKDMKNIFKATKNQ